MAQKAESTQELSPGIFLHKTQIQNKGSQDIIVILEIEIKKLSNIEITADFNGSRHVSIEGRNGLVATAICEAFQRKQVAKLILEPGHDLKNKITYILKPAFKETQMKYMKPELAKVIEDIEAARNVLFSVPYAELPVNEAISAVSSKKSDGFLDIDFEPSNDSLYGPLDISKTQNLNVVHWRRATACYENPVMFPAGPLKSQDIKSGALATYWFTGAIAAILESKLDLVKKLFITKEVNSAGLYRVKLCKNGLWTEVTVDDYIPCHPMGEPIYTRTSGNELWLILLEKAIAKLHGSYFNLRGGVVRDALADLTGCPVENLNFTDEHVKKDLANGDVWQKLKNATSRGYVMAGSIPGDDNKEPQVDKALGGLASGYGYPLIQAREHGGYKLVNLRNPYEGFEWLGNWSNRSPLWEQNPDVKQALGVNTEAKDGSFWMTWEDFQIVFKCVDICKVGNWHEIRNIGQFDRLKDPNNNGVESVSSKYRYNVTVNEPTKLIASTHQEDTRTVGVSGRRPNIDIGIVVLKNNGGELSFYAARDFTYYRQTELDVDLEPGSYVVLPRTTGCLVRRPDTAKSEKVKFFTNKGNLHEHMDAIIKLIFAVFDRDNDGVLSYKEFEEFYTAVGQHVEEGEFNGSICKKYTSHKGLGLRGFISFFRDSMNKLGEDGIFKWLDNLGFDKDLYPTRTRYFGFAIHTDKKASIEVKSDDQLEVDNKASAIIVQSFGKAEIDQDLKVLCYANKDAYAYSYAVVNGYGNAINFTLDLSTSKNLLYSSKTSVVTKRVEVGQTVFLQHSLAHLTAKNCTRALECSYVPAN